MPAPVERRTLWRQLGALVTLGGPALRLIRAACPWLALGLALALLLQALLSPLELLLSRALLDRAALDLGRPTPDRLAPHLPLLGWVGLAAAVMAIGQFLQPVAFTLQSLASDRLTGDVGERLIRAANRWQGLARFEDPAMADDLRRSREQAGQAALDLLIWGTAVAVGLFSALTAGLLLAGLQPLLPLLVLAASLPALARQSDAGGRTYGLLYTQTPATRRLEYLRDALLTPEPAKDVRLYGLAPFFRARYDAIYRDATRDLARLRFGLLGPLALSGLLPAAVTGGVVVWLARRIGAGTLPVGDLVLYGGAATLLHGAIGGVASDLGNLARPLGFLPSLFHVLDAPPDLPTPARPLPAPRPLRDGFLFERVDFAYPGAERPVLRDLSFRLAKGESLALVGHNGAGKTTIVKLLLRLYDPTAGRILLDGVDLREYDPADLRREIGVVFQDFVRYEWSAAENIGVGRPEALGDPARLRAAAAAAGATELLDRLPTGLDSALGRRFGGRELSGGEWQKLALARAFLRDAQVLVLDEPTAALDVQAEADVYRRFHALTAGRTTVLISHRFSTVRMADRILFLADGRIAEAGGHTALLAAGGEYARLYRLQASRYAEEG